MKIGSNVFHFVFHGERFCFGNKFDAEGLGPERAREGTVQCSAGPWGYAMPDLPPARSPLPFADFADVFFSVLFAAQSHLSYSLCQIALARDLKIFRLYGCCLVFGLFQDFSRRCQGLGHLSLTCASHISMPPPYILMLSAFEHL